MRQSRPRLRAYPRTRRHPCHPHLTLRAPSLDQQTHSPPELLIATCTCIASPCGHRRYPSLTYLLVYLPVISLVLAYVVPTTVPASIQRTRTHQSPHTLTLVVSFHATRILHSLSTATLAHLQPYISSSKCLSQQSRIRVFQISLLHPRA